MHRFARQDNIVNFFEMIFNYKKKKRQLWHLPCATPYMQFVFLANLIISHYGDKNMAKHFMNIQRIRKLTTKYEVMCHKWKTAINISWAISPSSWKLKLYFFFVLRAITYTAVQECAHARVYISKYVSCLL